MYPSASSTTLLHPSPSKSSLLSGGTGGGGYRDPYGALSRKKLETLGKASTPDLHFTTSTFSSSTTNLIPSSQYSIPGVPPGTHITYAVASARIYHNTQQTSITQKSDDSSLLNFGMKKKRNWSGNWGGAAKGEKKDKSQWVYSHLKGTLVFGQDIRRVSSSPGLLGDEEDMMAFGRVRVNATGSSASTSSSSTTTASSSFSRDEVEPRGDHWFQLVDDETAKVVWRFKIPPLATAAAGNASRKFSYEFDRPFFHVFQGSSRKYGFLFDDDREANIFLHEVTSRVIGATESIPSPPTKTMNLSLSRSFSLRSNKKSRNPSPAPPLPTSAAPSSVTVTAFQQLTHIGFNQTNNNNNGSNRPVEIK